MEDVKICNIFALSDYSLLHIFKYLSSSDLYNLSLTCKRFEELVKEKKLWHLIDARDGLNTKDKVKYCLDRMNEATMSFLVCSDERDTQILPDNFFTFALWSKLTVLALENQLICGDLAKLSEYPKSLVELSLRKSFVHSHTTFFKLSYWQMANLKVLILDECGWIETYMLVQMSKYAKLEVLSLYKCKKLSDNDIAYLSLAGCFGFKQLRILDIRFTGLGDQILKTFYKHHSLQELYFQNYICTYRLDKTRRHLAIARGAPMQSHPYFSRYDDVPDTYLESMQQMFGYHNYRTYHRQNLSNHGTVMYKFVVPNVDDDHKIKSVLYKSPYGKCTCGYADKFTNMFPKAYALKSMRNKREEINKFKDIIKEEKYKKTSPYMYMLAPKLHMDPYKNKTNIAFYEEQASETNRQIGWINVREPMNLYEIAMFEHTDVHSLQSDVNMPANMKSFDRGPTIILGDPGPKLGENSAAKNADGQKEQNANIALQQKFIPDDNGDMSVEELHKDNMERLSEAHKLDQSKDKVVNFQRFHKSEDGEESHSSKSELKKSKGSRDTDDRLTIKLDKCKNDPGKFNSKYNKADGDVLCKKCGVIVSDKRNEHSQIVSDICEDCKRHKSNKIIRVKFVRNKQDDDGARTSNDDAGNDEEPDATNLPSTSKTQHVPPSSFRGNSTKRRRDSSSTFPKFKKIKLNDDENSNSQDLDISYEVEDVNVSLCPPNIVYINVNRAEQLDQEPNLINVPMGDGLINILLGVDTKTKVAIKKLSLRGFPKITDCTLTYLSRLKLDLLDVTRTSVSIHAVQKFMRQNPSCRVLHETACICLPNMHF